MLENTEAVSEKAEVWRQTLKVVENHLSNIDRFQQAYDFLNLKVLFNVSEELEDAKNVEQDM